MFRAFVVVAAIGLVLPACHAADAMQPAPSYTTYLGGWSGVVDGSTVRGDTLAADLELTLDLDGTSLVLRGMCGNQISAVHAYQQDERAAYFVGDAFQCSVHTPCGTVQGRAGGVVLMPTETGHMAAQISFAIPGCSASGDDFVLMSGTLSR